MEWASTRRGYRDGALSVGLRLHEYVRARLAEGDGCSEAERLRKRASRACAIADAAKRLKLNQQRINELIRAAQAARLLGPIGGFSYSSVRALRVLVHRPSKGAAKLRTRSDVPSSWESWAIRPQYLTTGPQLVADAVAKSWNERELWAELQRITRNKRKIKPRRREGGKTFTSGEVARLCDVAPRTAAKWCDSDKLKSYRLPLSRDRRVYKADLVEFIVAAGMQLPRELSDVQLLRYACSGVGKLVSTPYELGALVERHLVSAAIVGDDFGTAEAVRAAEYLVTKGVQNVVLQVSADAVLAEPPVGAVMCKWPEKAEDYL